MELAVKYCIVADYLMPNFLAISLGSAIFIDYDIHGFVTNECF